MTTAEEAAQLYFMTVSPFTIDRERYRTSAAIIEEIPGSEIDRQRQAEWAADNQAVKAVRENHRLNEIARMRERDRITKLKQQRERNKRYNESRKARAMSGPSTLKEAV